VTNALNPLDSIARMRGAVMTKRAGVSVPAHYGSAAAELSACVLGVGMAARADLAKLLLSGPPNSLNAIAQRHAGVELSQCGAAATSAGWWCAEANDRVLAIVAPDLRSRLHAALAREGRPLGVRVIDASGRLATVALAGRRMQHLLAALALVLPSCDLRSIPAYSAHQISGVEVSLLLESRDRALLVVDATNAAEIWHAVEIAGRPLGLSLIGLEALERFAMIEMIRARTVAVA
jgi:glycine cleavage system aminomethyltransferase T